MVSDFFLLNPRYENYDLGMYALEFQTVYGDTHARLGSATGRAILFSVLMTFVLKLGSLRGGQLFTPEVVDQLIKIVIVGAFALAIGGEAIALFHTVQANRRYQKLIKNGKLLTGQLIKAEAKETEVYHYPRFYPLVPKVQLSGTYFIEVRYQLISPDQLKLYGTQTMTREDFRDKPMPVAGTPVRVLYADETTHIML